MPVWCHLREENECTAEYLCSEVIMDEDAWRSINDTMHSASNTFVADTDG